MIMMHDEEEKSSEHEDLELIDEPEEDGLLDLGKNLEKKQDALRACEQERKEYLDGWQRAKADLINYKNDEGKRLEDIGRFITGGLLRDILPVLDSFDLALQSFSAQGGQQATGNQMEQGVLMIRSQLLDVLQKRGVAHIQVQLGETFDPEKHESIGEIESLHPAGSIAEEVQKGYMLAGRVIRPARVRLGRGG